MKSKIIFSTFIVLIIGITSYSFSDEIDYRQLFRTVKSSLNQVEIEGDKAQLIQDNQEFANILKSGLNSFNILAPYINREKNLRSILSELSNFKLTLRSAKNTKIYQKAIYATVLIIDPEGIGEGTGFVIDKPRGLIVTNFHVTSGFKNLFVAFYNEKVQDPSMLKFYSASVVKYSAKRDIAVLKLLSSPPSIQELSLDDTSKPSVGEEVHTIGHPLSLTWTYSRGLITAIRNRFRFGEEKTADVIQIDASVSPGNSGGPLLNESGNIIGMVTFTTSDQYAQNLNFAVSCNEIKKVLNSRKNEDTSISKALQRLYGLKLFSLKDALRGCRAYRVDEDGDGKTDYISLINSTTNKEKYRYIKSLEIEIEPGKRQPVNVLLIDYSKDGVMDVMMIDYDLDMIFDFIMVDIDLDGEPDIIGTDAEGKGYITQAWIL